MDRVVKVSCLPESVDKVKEALLDIKTIDFPVSRSTIMEHGGYGRITRFKTKQHKYAGGGYGSCGGYVEVLEIEDPPDGRCGIIINEYDGQKGFRFHKFRCLEDALAAWKISLYRFDNAPGYIETVVCGELDPWFYAVANQALYDEFAFPNWVCDDPIYRPGKWFIVNDDVMEVDEPKLCMGMHRIGKEKDYISVWWSDGTTSRGNRSRLDGCARPVEFRFNDPEQSTMPEILWMQEAYDFMKEVVRGQVDGVAIETPDGTIITVKTQRKSRSHCMGTCRGPQLEIDGGEKVEAIIRAGHKTVLIGRKKAEIREVKPKEKRNKSIVIEKEEEFEVEE
jgi:hypothetical protein